MAFHHDGQGRARFGAKGSMKPKPHPGGPESHPQAGQRPVHHTPGGGEEEKHGTPPKHVEHTHPGETTGHPSTGVHAFHAHHKGGGAYTSHTHHGDGSVETREHPDQQDMLSAMHEAFPAENEADEEREGPADGTEYGEELAAGIGGTKVA